ncbi:MAG: dockerin type I repeat-containing protein [Oscillospiraceae bacterium]|nr:dockerin type I repeat-containing protein [Oscillospiraceae bacterium]
MRFTYDVQSREILQIAELELEENAHVLRGDVDQNGAFELNDIVLVQRWLLAEQNTVLADWQAGDFNSDGRLNAADLTLMKRALIN